MSPRRSLGSQRAVFLAWSTRRSRWESNCHRRRSEQPKLSEKSSSIASKATKSEGRLLTSNYNFAYHLSFSLEDQPVLTAIVIVAVEPAAAVGRLPEDACAGHTAPPRPVALSHGFLTCPDNRHVIVSFLVKSLDRYQSDRPDRRPEYRFPFDRTRWCRIVWGA